MPNLKNFYFTFGSDPAFPFQNTFLIIRSVSESAARNLYPLIYPNRDPNTDILNFSFSYNDDEWFGIDNRDPVKHHYANQKPAEVIIDTLDGSYIKMPLNALNKLKSNAPLTDVDRNDLIAYMSILDANFKY